jgi:hypothetical protein
VNRHPVLFGLGLLVAPFAVLLQVGMFAGNGFVAGMVWFLIQAAPVAYVIWIRRVARDIARRKAQEAALVARADYEHTQLCQGNISVGVYGAFQPANIHHLATRLR